MLQKQANDAKYSTVLKWLAAPVYQIWCITTQVVIGISCMARILQFSDQFGQVDYSTVMMLYQTIFLSLFDKQMEQIIFVCTQLNSILHFVQETQNSFAEQLLSTVAVTALADKTSDLDSLMKLTTTVPTLEQFENALKWFATEDLSYRTKMQTACLILTQKKGMGKDPSGITSIVETLNRKYPNIMAGVTAQSLFACKQTYKNSVGVLQGTHSYLSVLVLYQLQSILSEVVAKHGAPSLDSTSLAKKIASYLNTSIQKENKKRNRETLKFDAVQAQYTLIKKEETAQKSSKKSS